MSLRDQCHAHNLYGADGALEAAFANLEGIAATVVAEVRERLEPPPANSEAHAGLVSFVAFQLVRTLAAKAEAAAMSGEFVRMVFDGQAPDNAQMSREEAFAAILGVGPEMFETMLDLAIALIVTRGPRFLTSDNPAFKYNQYCEGIRSFGVTGTKSRGLQVFLPLSPDLLLLLYDSGVYKVGARSARGVAIANDQDVWELNRLQFMSAQDNVFFSDWALAAECKTLAQSITRAKVASGPRVTKAYNVDNDRDVLLHQFSAMPQLGLELSVMSLRRNARRIPLVERGQLLRDGRKTSIGRPGDGAIRFETHPRS